MSLRTASGFIESLRDGREIWLGGERVVDVTEHPLLRGAALTIAALYGLQHRPDLQDRLSVPLDESGERIGYSHIQPRTRDDLRRRREMIKLWADENGGMLGRTPDFMNMMFAGYAAAHEYFAQGGAQFGENIRRYYEHIRENDLTLTHALINLQRSRTVSGMFNLEEGTALSVVRETDAGIIVRGARVLATLGPMADEIAVYSPRVARHTEKHSPFALNFAIPCGTRGLKFLCRESFDLGRSHFDHPLGSRFEEMDTVVFFDDVLVPWERVFVLGDVDLINATAVTTHSAVHTAHQGAAKNLAKSEFVLGVALLMTHTLGNAHLPHTEERLAELTMYAELTRACIRSAEADARLDEWGVMCPVPLQIELTRNLFMTAYPRMAEILELLGSSSFMIVPSEADFQSPLAPNIEQYLATDTAGARDRVKLFRLAWDIAGSAFGSRQVLYERFFASDPLTRARALNSMYPRDAAMERVRKFLDDDAS